MEILYIIIGILSAVSTFAIGYSVMGVFRIQKKMESVFGYIDTIQRKHDSTENDIHRRIDMEVQNCNNYIDEVNTRVDTEVKDILSMVDSRLDKLENRITSKIPPTNEDVLSELKQLKQEFLTLRKNL
jgi:hemerythrin-like domain-containing protein